VAAPPACGLGLPSKQPCPSPTRISPHHIHEHARPSRLSGDAVQHHLHVRCEAPPGGGGAWRGLRPSPRAPPPPVCKLGPRAAAALNSGKALRKQRPLAEQRPRAPRASPRHPRGREFHAEFPPGHGVRVREPAAARDRALQLRGRARVGGAVALPGGKGGAGGKRRLSARRARARLRGGAAGRHGVWRHKAPGRRALTMTPWCEGPAWQGVAPTPPRTPPPPPGGPGALTMTPWCEKATWLGSTMFSIGVSADSGTSLGQAGAAGGAWAW
jgi:hypothetical protein